jgi:FKBP-type peptidyl-prolyl cis-trans isomerase FkpA
MKYLIYTILFALLIGNTACLGPSQAEEDEETIQGYLSDKKLTAIKHASGLHYIINAPGSGDNPNLSNKVRVHYKGFLTDGRQFDGTTKDPVEFDLAGLITGWQIGIPLIKRGGDIKLILPSYLAYGTKSAGIIPPNSVLIFDIQLIDFK